MKFPANIFYQIFSKNLFSWKVFEFYNIKRIETVRFQNTKKYVQKIFLQKEKVGK